MLKPQKKKSPKNKELVPDGKSVSTSQHKLEYDAIRDENNQLRGEIMMRLQKQQEITSFSIAVLVGFITLNQFLSNGNTNTIGEQSIKAFYPLISIIYSAFSLMVLEHEVNIAHIYIYIDTVLQSRLMKIIANDNNGFNEIWTWNRFRAKVQHHSGLTNIFNMIMAWSKYAMTIIPNVSIVILFVLNDYENLRSFFITGETTISVILFILSLIIFGWVIITGIYTGSLYLRMEHN